MQKLLPITEKIERELEKEQDERVDFKIDTDAAATLKNHLETFKAQLRPDWNGKFQMWRNTTGLEIRFGLRKTLNFRIPNPAEVPAFTVPDAQIAGLDGVAQEVDDVEACGILLEMNSVVISKLKMSDASRLAIEDPINGEPTALTNLATRMGYTIRNLPDRVKFSLG